MTENQESPPLLGGLEEASPPVPRKPIEETPPEETGKVDTPAEKPPTYEEKLKESGIDILEARQIMEHLATNDCYEETTHIGSLALTLRTRLYNDVIRTQRLIEAENPTYNMTISELSARYNLAASLSSFGDRKFKFVAPDDDLDASEAAFEERLKFVIGRPGPVILKMMTKLHKFDAKIAAIFEDGAAEDF